MTGDSPTKKRAQKKPQDNKPFEMDPKFEDSKDRYEYEIMKMYEEARQEGAA